MHNRPVELINWDYFPSFQNYRKEDEKENATQPVSVQYV